MIVAISSKDSAYIDWIGTHGRNNKCSVDIIYDQYELRHLGVVGEEKAWDALELPTQTTHLIPDVFLSQYTVQESRKKDYKFYFLFSQSFWTQEMFLKSSSSIVSSQRAASGKWGEIENWFIHSCSIKQASSSQIINTPCKVRFTRCNTRRWIYPIFKYSTIEGHSHRIYKAKSQMSRTWGPWGVRFPRLASNSFDLHFPEGGLECFLQTLMGKGEKQRG